MPLYFLYCTFLRKLLERHQDKLALGNKDMELLNQENERLRAHVKAFQRDVNEILAHRKICCEAFIAWAHVQPHIVHFV